MRTLLDAVRHREKLLQVGDAVRFFSGSSICIGRVERVRAQRPRFLIHYGSVENSPIGSYGRTWLEAREVLRG